MSELTHDISWKAIEKIYRYQNREYFTLVLADGLNFAELTVTDDHPVWVANKGWIKTRDLQLGDQLQGQDGELWDVIAWESQARHGETYNFEVEGYHTYFVGEDGLWVHNGGPCDYDHQTQKQEVERPVEYVTKNAPNKNSRAYDGEIHVYAIRNPDGTVNKIGESAQGTRVGDGASKRAEQQVRKSNREVGPGHTSEIRKTFPNKDAARTYETNVIERYRKMYGQDTLPGNKTNR